MQWSETVEAYIQQLKPVEINTALKEKLVRLIDLTSLNSTDTESSIASFVQKAQTSFGDVAAVCVYPQFAGLVHDSLAGLQIKTATVVNFPQGHLPLNEVLIEIGQALSNGVDEVDVVFPYQAYLLGKKEDAKSFVSACKAACGDHVKLKVILETGVLKDPTVIANASYDVFTAGADFVKTSTGKISEGATLLAAGIMLLVASKLSKEVKHPLGVKVAGGIKDLSEATQFLELADKILGPAEVNANTFRIGSSKLIDEIK